jgi:hypothetical protein
MKIKTLEISKDELLEELTNLSKSNPVFGLKIIEALYIGATSREQKQKEFSVYLETAFVAKEKGLSLSKEVKGFLSENKDKFVFADTFKNLKI